MTIIEEVYKKVPKLNCKGKCQNACGVIACSAIEAENLANNGIIPPNTHNHPKWGELTCTHLTNDGKCVIYENRPLICRLYGVTKALKCQHGCKPKDGYLTDEQAHELIQKLESQSDKPYHIGA